MSSHDAHYGGNLVDGAKMLQLFGNVATELLIINDGDEGLFCAYDSVEFLAPAYAGNYCSLRADNGLQSVWYLCGAEKLSACRNTLMIRITRTYSDNNRRFRLNGQKVG